MTKLDLFETPKTLCEWFRRCTKKVIFDHFSQRKKGSLHKGNKATAEKVIAEAIGVFKTMTPRAADRQFAGEKSGRDQKMGFTVFPGDFGDLEDSKGPLGGTKWISRYIEKLLF